MARILVVSRNPAMSMSLAGIEHDVDTCRPALLDRWTEGTDQADAYILDLGVPGEATAAVDHLRSTGRSGPVLLVAGSSGPWADLEGAPPPGCAVLPLPVTRPRLVAALEGLLQAPPTRSSLSHTPPRQPVEAQAVTDPPGSAAARDEAPAAGEHAPVPVSTMIDLSTLADAPPEQALQAAVAEPRTAAAGLVHSEEPESDPLPADPEPLHAYVPRPRPPLPPVAAPLTTPAPTQPPIQPAEAHWVSASAAGAAVAVAAPAPAPAPAPASAQSAQARPYELAETFPTSPPSIDLASPTMGLVHALKGRADDLLGVQETAEAVVSDAIARTGAVAAALLVPDDGIWRVAAGSGLRTLESRCELAGDTWLVQMVARSRKGMLVEGSDIVRVKMSGAPLASWPHLAATPVPTVGAILLAARADHAFSEVDLTALAALGEEAEGPITDALAVRELARRLDEHRNPRDHEGAR